MRNPADPEDTDEREALEGRLAEDTGAMPSRGGSQYPEDAPEPGGPLVTPPPANGSSVYDLGDVALTGVHAQASGGSRRRRPIPWSLVTLAGAAVVAFVFVYLPAREEAGQTQEVLDEVRDRNEALTRQVVSLEKALERLEDDRDSLAIEAQRRGQERGEIEEIQRQLSTALHGEASKGIVSITLRGRRIVIDVAERVLFETSGVRLSTHGRSFLKRLAGVLLALPARIAQVGAHSDSTSLSPQQRRQFPTAWELSVLRATAVVRCLQTEGGMPGDRLVAAGFAEYHPRARNTTKSGRRRNRRVEIVLMPPIEG